MTYTWNRLTEIQAIIREVTGYVATVAGGAVRDKLAGNPIKDVDALIEVDRLAEDYTDHDMALSIARKVAAAFGDSPMVTTSLVGYEASSPGDTYATFDITTEQGEAINLIFVSSIEDAINEFPDTISQVWLSDIGTIQSSTGYEASMSTNIVLHTLQGERGEARLAKLEGKFPTFKFVQVPDGFLPKVSL